MTTQNAEANAEVIDEKSIQDLPLDGRRFSDLALMVPGVVADPRSTTSDSNGDLSSGGIRGFQSSFLVDGADNNNGFFAQARGRYRAPYQFSNEVVQEFRVNTNSHGAELGRAGEAVINVVTKSGTNAYHGKLFYFLRDSSFGAKPPFLDFKPEERRHQLGRPSADRFAGTGPSSLPDMTSTSFMCLRSCASALARLRSYHNPKTTKPAIVIWSTWRHRC